MLDTHINKQKILNHLLIALGGSLLVLAGLFYASANIGHEISPRRLIEMLKASSKGYFGLYLLMMAVGLLFRAWRYRVLLVATGEVNLPDFKQMTLITAVRNMTVDLLPVRLGEIVFVALLKRQANTAVSSGLSALLFATLLDILVLAPFTIVIGLMVGFPTKQPYALALIALSVVAVFMLGIYFILPYLLGIFQRWAVHSNKVISRVFSFVLSISEAVQTTMWAGVFSQVIALTFIVRFLKYAGLLCLFFGITQANFPSIAELGSMKILGSLIASEMTASLPIPALMSFGTWELGGMSMLAYFGAMPQNALLTMLGVHVQTQAVDYGVGIAALAALFLIGKRSVEGSAEESTLSQTFGQRRLNKGVLAFVALAALFSWFGIKHAKEAQTKVALHAANQGSVTVRPDAEPLPAWLSSTEGFIVWSSNRSGNHDIWRMRLPDLQLTQLTTSPHTENYARISPDGTKMVFARSHELWQSMRDKKPWDIWLLDLTTGKESLLAKWGVSPSWSPDGRSVVFQRSPAQIMVVNIRTGEERLYYESGKDAFMKARVDLHTPTIGKDKRMAFTFRNGGQPTNIIRDAEGQFQTVHRDACQVQWSPSGEFVTYVQKGGKQINQIMRFDPESKTKTTLLDLPGEYSHEYFAHFSKNEQFMVFAASAGGHEHDLADYELFMWPMGKPVEEAVRLTFNGANDSWPDVWLEE